MNADQLRALQAPVKKRYKEDPAAGRLTLKASGSLDSPDITCKVKTEAGPVVAGLHPATGGDGQAACSGDMLLQALVGCAGVTLRAVATALGVPLRGAPSPPKAISISAVPWASARRYLSVFRKFDCTLTWIATHRRNNWNRS